MLERALAAHGASAWCEKLAAAGIMHERVNTYTDFLSEPQVDAVGAVAWLNQAGVDRAVPIPNIPGAQPLIAGTQRAESPVLGQHTRGVLSDAGFLSEEIDDLLGRGLVPENATQLES